MTKEKRKIYLLFIKGCRIVECNFNEVYIEDDYYYIKYKDVEYHCLKNKDWYCDFRHCFVINPKKLKEAKQEFFNKISEEYDGFIDRLEREIKSYNLKRSLFEKQLLNKELKYHKSS